MKTQITQSIKVVVLALMLSAGIAFATYSEPGAAPTGANTDAPINIGSSNQTKTGGLSVGGATIFLGTLQVGGSFGGGSAHLTDLKVYKLAAGVNGNPNSGYPKHVCIDSTGNLILCTN